MSVLLFEIHQVMDQVHMCPRLTDYKVQNTRLWVIATCDLRCEITKFSAISRIMLISNCALRNDLPAPSMDNILILWLKDHIHALSVCLSFSFVHTHTHKHTHAHIYMRENNSLSLSLSLSLKHTHTHTLLHAFTHTHTYVHICNHTHIYETHICMRNTKCLSIFNC